MHKISNLVFKSKVMNNRIDVVKVENDNQYIWIPTHNVIRVDQDVKVTWLDFAKHNKSDSKHILGITYFSKQLVYVLDLPSLLNTVSLNDKLIWMQSTRQAHINFVNKLESLVMNRINQLNWEPYDLLDFDLQLDHTQCAFWKLLFKYIKMMDKNPEVLSFLNEFVEPHKNFHSKVIKIKENFDNIDILTEVLNDIKNNDFIKLMSLFDKFDDYIKQHLKNNKFLFITYNDSLLCIRVDSINWKQLLEIRGNNELDHDDQHFSKIWFGDNSLIPILDIPTLFKLTNNEKNI